MGNGEMLRAALGAVLRDGVIYVVTPDGEIEEAEPLAWVERGKPFLTRAAAEAAAAKIKGVS